MKLSGSFSALSLSGLNVIGGNSVLSGRNATNRSQASSAGGGGVRVSANDVGIEETKEAEPTSSSAAASAASAAASSSVVLSAKTRVASPSQSTARSSSKTSRRPRTPGSPSSLTSRHAMSLPIEEQVIEVITEEDRRLAMLGYTNTSTGLMQPYLYREDFCACCGTMHPKPSLLNVYNICYSCQNTLREPLFLRKRYENTLQELPLEIIYATYGDPFDVNLAEEVTLRCQQKVLEYPNKDRITFKAHQNLQEFFGFDPAPGRLKQLRIRYRMDGIFGTVVFNVTAENVLPDWVLLAVPERRLVKIKRASYGHPRGLNEQGRMSFDILELIQGLLDVSGGSYLKITTLQPISQIFGDPCPGYTKDMRLEFEVLSTRGFLK